MDRKAGSEGLQWHQRRIVALMLALADLAERASTRSTFILRILIWLLQPGEAVARDHVLAVTGCAPYRQSTTRVPRGPADRALRLAFAFRALAAVLSAFLRRASILASSAGLSAAYGAVHAAGGAAGMPAAVSRAIDRLDSS